MFLLSKLDKASALFPDDVEGTREFLLDRGIPAGSIEALTHFSARLAIDPSFRRDVTSLVQVVIQREKEEVDYMDLLGILIVAAAGTGPLNPSDEQEESVREILRFLTQVRRPAGALSPVFVRSQNVVPRVIAPEPFISDRASLPATRAEHVAVRPVSSGPLFQMDEAQSSRGRGATVWVVGVMVAAVALGLGWMIYRNNSPAPQTLTELQTGPSSKSPVNEDRENPAPPAEHAWKPQPVVPRKASPVAARHLNGSRTSAEAPSMEHVEPVRPPRSPDVGQSFAPKTLTASAKPIIIASNSAAPRPSNGVPESAAPANTTTMGVRRRLPKSVVINPAPLRRSGESAGNLNTSAPGVVHPASIGMMASNLISSPAPAYPAAASQARVQGEVMVRAVVNREGNVIDARVVSGPELLRDVSLEAVQRWHYRPYMHGGKPIEVATTAVLDFELP